MIKPSNLRHAQQFESMCTHIVAEWERTPDTSRAFEKMQDTGYYRNAMDAQWILSTIAASDQLNRDLFMEANDVIDTRTNCT